MKKLFYIAIICALSCNVFVLAQSTAHLPLESKPDLELTCEEADARIANFQQKVDALTQKLNELNASVTTTEAELKAKQQAVADCEKEILALIGATDSDLEKYRQQLGVLEGKVRQMKGLSNDALADRRAEVEALEAELNTLRANKLAVLPEFYDKIISLARDIKGLYREKEVSGYTVGTWAQDRDCLWNIAGKSEIYGDPFQWPKIWQANTDIIRNPDIIHAGQVLQIPPPGPKTDEESKAERRYWRNKRAAAAEQQETQPTP